MGFFSDLKEDLSQAVNELMPEEEKIRSGEEEPEEAKEAAQEVPVEETPAEETAAAEETSDFSIDAMLQNIDNIQVPEETESSAEPAETSVDTDAEMEKLLNEMLAGDVVDQPSESETNAASEEQAPDTFAETAAALAAQEESAQASVTEENTYDKGVESFMETESIREAVDETSVITGGMTIVGDVTTEGSIDVIGTVNGNIDALGKLNITGHINGNSKAAEVYCENAKINGEVSSAGAVKIGSSSVIIGNISATSAVIAGAVKGDIDVRGPVILDASAIVMGNIKSKSVQINNGAVIEGMCSQCYAEVSPTSFFDDYKPETRKSKK